MTAEDNQLTGILFDLVPKDGTSVGNVTLLQQFRDMAKKKLGVGITNDRYWDVRNKLISDGLLDKGRGKGGSVYRVKQVEISTKKKKAKRTKEADLYPMVGQYIRQTWVKDNEISQFVLEKTASQGKNEQVENGLGQILYSSR